MTLKELENILKSKLENINTKKTQILEGLKNSLVPISDNEKCRFIEIRTNQNGKDYLKFERELNEDEDDYSRKWIRNYIEEEIDKTLK